MRSAPAAPVRRTPRLGAVVALALALVASACATDPAPPAAVGPGGPYVAARPAAFHGRVVGTGQCVDLVKAAAGAPRTAAWRPGAPVRGNPDLAPGTAIATFEPDGTYASRSGSHAALYLSQDATGIWVYDQWKGQPVHRRLIRFEGGRGSKRGVKSNDGDRFAVIR